MKKMLTTSLLFGLSLLFSGCIAPPPFHKPPYHGKALPPGQVKNATGYNPASGKLHEPKRDRKDDEKWNGKKKGHKKDKHDKGHKYDNKDR